MQPVYLTGIFFLHKVEEVATVELGERPLVLIDVEEQLRVGSLRRRPRPCPATSPCHCSRPYAFRVRRTPLLVANCTNSSPPHTMGGRAHTDRDVGFDVGSPSAHSRWSRRNRVTTSTCDVCGNRSSPTTSSAR